MALDEGDFLSWYNSEITRYRDYEWAVSGYAGAFSLAVVYLATDPDRKSILQEYYWLISPILLVFACLLVGSEAHIHRRLNDFRAKRSALIQESGHHVASGHLIERRANGSLSRTNLLYFLGFEFFIAGTALGGIFLVTPSWVSSALAVVSAVFVLSVIATSRRTE